MTLRIPHEARISAEAARVASLGLCGTAYKPRRDYSPKGKAPPRTPAQQAKWDAMIAAWRAEPYATAKAIAMRFDCHLVTAYRARDTAKAVDSLTPRAAAR